MHGLSPVLSESIECVLKLFADGTPLSDRAAFMRNQQQAVTMALGGDTPPGVPGTPCTIAKLLQ